MITTASKLRLVVFESKVQLYTGYRTEWENLLVNWIGLTEHVAKGGNFSGEIDRI